MMNKRLLKVVVLGNSVALRVRPPDQYPDNLNYTQFLKSLLLNCDSFDEVEVINMAIGGDTVNDMLAKIDVYISTFPDVFILNIGVVDASTRDIPRWFFNYINNNREGFPRSFLRLFYNAFIKKFRRLMVVTRGKRPWITYRRFKRIFRTFVGTLIKETNARIIILPINKGSERVEKQIPGSLRNFQKYSDYMKDLSGEFETVFISLDHLDCQTDYPDGIHYSRSGHNKLAKILFKDIKTLTVNKQTSK